ncbi:hypothetical protein ACQJBY_037800 [Aegilops geniculata]
MVTVPVAAAGLIAMVRFGAEELASRLSVLNPVHLFLACFFPAAAAIVYLMLRPRAVYLVDYAGFRTPSNCRVPFATFLEHARQLPEFNERSIRFMTRLLERSGLVNETCLPPTHHYIGTHKYCTVDAARAEFELVAFSAVDDLLAKTGIAPDAIDILIVNCSLFCPTPSLVDMIINKYRLRSDIRAMHLSGMGCSAGMISVGLARNLLQVAPRGAHALVVSTETVTPNYYFGTERAAVDIVGKGPVPPKARRAHAHRCRGQFVPVCVSGGGRRGPPGDQPQQGPDEHRRQLAQGQYHRNWATRPAGQGAAYVRLLLRRTEGDRQESETVHPRLPHGV